MRRRYHRSMSFLWDFEKAEANRKKHGVLFPEAASIFLDPFAITITDPDHSEGEERFVTIGMSSKGFLLVVVHTEVNDSIRIISAREATAHERRRYED